MRPLRGDVSIVPLMLADVPWPPYHVWRSLRILQLCQGLLDVVLHLLLHRLDSALWMLLWTVCNLQPSGMVDRLRLSFYNSIWKVYIEQLPAFALLCSSHVRYRDLYSPSLTSSCQLWVNPAQLSSNLLLPLSSPVWLLSSWSSDLALSISSLVLGNRLMRLFTTGFVELVYFH